VRAETLNVAPGLVGEPLATPSRRALALLIDLAVVSALAHLAPPLVLMGALVAAAAVWWASHRSRPVSRAALACAALLVAVGLVAGRGDEPDTPALDEEAAELDTRLESAAARLKAAAALMAQPGASAAAVAASAAAAAASEPGGATAAPAVAAASTAGRAATAPPSAASAAETLSALIARLETLEARRAAAMTTEFDRWRHRAQRWIDEVGPGYGWSLLYWSLLPVLWPGQTLGKRLCGLRVVELTGRPMTPWIGLKRYGGYAAGLATGGLGLAQVLWDPNRQGLQDKAAHTVVIDLRAPRAPAAPVDPDGAGAEPAQRPSARSSSIASP
jgi:uncharacterized RDD family membrane protein YckC